MIDIPPELRWLGYLVGVDLPAADESQLFAIGQAWSAASRDIAAQVGPLADARAKATGSYQAGAGAEKISALFDELLDGDGSLARLAAGYDELGNAAFDFGTTVEAAKLMMIVSYVMLLMEILWAWAFPPTAPAVEAAAVAGTRSALRRVEDAVITRIEQLILRAFGAAGNRAWTKLVVKNLATYTVKGTVSGVQSVLVDTFVQAGQMAGGTRREFDGNQTLLSFGASFAGGLFGRVAAHWAGIGYDASLGRVLNNRGLLAAGARGAAIGATAGVVGSVGGSIATALHSGDWAGSFTPGGFALGATGGGFRGAVAGGSRGLFQLGRVPGGVSRTGFLRHFQLDAEGNVYLPANQLAAAGVRPTGVRPDPVPRPPDPATTPRQQRALRALDRQDAANLRDYRAQQRLAQPTLRADADPTGPERPPRARAAGLGDDVETVDRQPKWAARMGGPASEMQARADSTQATADRAQNLADVCQRQADRQQTRADSEADVAADKRRRMLDAEHDLRSRTMRLAELREGDQPDPRRVEQAEQRVARANAAHANAVREYETAARGAASHQRLADQAQQRADRFQHTADRAQDRADAARMVRVDPDAVNRAAAAEARPAAKPIGAENNWWQRALLRSEQLGKEYGTGGPGTDRYQSKGTDLRAKTRPRLADYAPPSITPYNAPDAPDQSAWGRAETAAPQPDDPVTPPDPDIPVCPPDPDDPVDPPDPDDPVDPPDPDDPVDPPDPDDPVDPPDPDDPVDPPRP
ncbi:WXG100-like domain-containing protein [Nocardia gipuzkoensis]